MSCKRPCPTCIKLQNKQNGYPSTKPQSRRRSFASSRLNRSTSFPCKNGLSPKLQSKSVRIATASSRSDSHSRVRQNAVRPAGLHLANDGAGIIHLHAAQDILRPRYPSKVWRVPSVAEMHPSSSSCACGFRLRTCVTCARLSSAAATLSPEPFVRSLRRREEDPSTYAQVECARASKGSRLADQVVVLMAVLRHNLVED